MSACSAVAPPAANQSSLPQGLTADVALASATVRAGRAVRGVVTLTNHLQQPVSFGEDAAGTDGVAVYSAQGRELATSPSSDAVSIRPVDIPAGGSARITATVSATQCGDTSRDPRTPLPAGRYRVILWFNWSTAHPAVFGHFRAPAETLTVMPSR